jgi:hypothetical protein
MAKFSLGARTIDPRRPDHRNAHPVFFRDVAKARFGGRLGHAVKATRRQNVVLAERRTAIIAPAMD